MCFSSQEPSHDKSVGNHWPGSTTLHRPLVELVLPRLSTVRNRGWRCLFIVQNPAHLIYLYRVVFSPPLSSIRLYLFSVRCTKLAYRPNFPSYRFLSLDHVRYFPEHKYTLLDCMSCTKLNAALLCVTVIGPYLVLDWAQNMQPLEQNSNALRLFSKLIALIMFQSIELRMRGLLWRRQGWIRNSAFLYNPDWSIFTFSFNIFS